MDKDVSRRSYRLVVGAATAAVAAFLLAQLQARPPHEDEALALFVGHKPLGELFDVVLGERGGAPLHFLLVHMVSAVSPTLTALRVISIVFAVASIPVVAALVARLVDRRTACVATVIVAASWVTLFHGVYGRMYSLFLFTSALSFLALLRAVHRNDRMSWALWALAVYAALASHQYGAFVLGAQVVYIGILRARRLASLMPGVIALAIVLVAATPIWKSNLVLASRFDVGIGGGGRQLGGPIPVLEYIRSALGDFVAGWTVLFVVIAAIAGLGLVLLARSRPASALLAGLAFLLPTIGLMLARVGGSASAPETRHLIFALPFFAMLLACGLLPLARLAGPRAPAALALSLAVLVACETAWGWRSTPTLYSGEPSARREAREAAEAWLARTSRPTDVLFGFDPLFLGARGRGGEIGETVVPRADPKLALETLLDASKPLGRGVWVLDASDGARIEGNRLDRLEIPDRSPGSAFETKVFGPFLIVRTIEPTLSPDAFLSETERVQAMGIGLEVVAAGLHYETAHIALEELEEAG